MATKQDTILWQQTFKNQYSRNLLSFNKERLEVIEPLEAYSGLVTVNNGKHINTKTEPCQCDSAVCLCATNKSKGKVVYLSIYLSINWSYFML